MNKSLPVVTSWSPSRFDHYQTCPLKFKLQNIDRLCPLCYHGHLEGWDTPRCPACGSSPEESEALSRGNWLHKQIEMFLSHGQTFDEAAKPIIKNVWKLLMKLRHEVMNGKVRVEYPMVFAKDWIPVKPFTKGAWLRTKADVLWVDGKNTKIIDWKSGGIDKRTGKPRDEQAKYADQMEIYCIAGLSVLPAIDELHAELVFLDAKSGDNVVECPPVKRKDLKKLKKKWDGKILPMFSDDVFAPRANSTCRFCDYRKALGGPCPY